MGKSGNIWLKLGKWVIVTILFTGALAGSAWTGISLAKKNLPPWVGEPSGFLRGDEVEIGAQGQMVYLSEENQKIKDFFNRYSSVEERLQADLDKFKVRRLTAAVKVKVKKQDAGTVSVEILSGPLNGEVFWMQVSQLSLSKKGEDLPLIKDDGGKEEPQQSETAAGK